MKKIGITGGIGVGKTYVSKLFSKMGVPVFNADIEAKKCLVEDKKLMDDVMLAFGNNVYSNGVLQKDILASIVFNNEEALSKLNSLVHPVVKQKFENWCKEQNSKIVMKEAAILFESNSNVGLDAVICISADESVRISRVMERDKCSASEVKKRMNKQMGQLEKEKLSDYVIVNNGSELLLPQLVNILKEIN